MGKVVTTVRIRNAEDVHRARRAEIRDSEVREVTLEGVLCDTGATVLCLPRDVIDALGLPLLERADVVTAAGIFPVGIYDDARITVEGRTRNVDCIELPGGREPLLGVIPMEQLGLELDLQNQRLVKLPLSGQNAYLTA